MCPGRCCPATRILKKAYKTYTVKTWQGHDILCEPYQVQNGDWLLKIFRKKGNLSELNFPRFLNIFKHINPQIHNPDHIRPGQQITIPLKKINSREFTASTKGRVIVPILQMSEVSDKMDRGTGQKKISSLNPSPALKLVAQPMGIEQPALKSTDMKNIRRYAAMKGGNVLNTGIYYFPGPAQEDMELNLAATPIVQLKDKSKIVILPQGFAKNNFLQGLEDFRHKISIMSMEMLNKELLDISQTTPPIMTLPSNKQAALEMLLKKTDFELQPYETTILMEGGIKIAISAQLVPRRTQAKADLLIFQGSVYGHALTLLKYQGYAIVSILPGDKIMVMAKKLFKGLGIYTMENPVFMNPSSGQSISIPGLFIGDGKNIFLSLRPVNPVLQHFFSRNKVQILQIDDPANPGTKKASK